LPLSLLSASEAEEDFGGMMMCYSFPFSSFAVFFNPNLIAIL
jgi:hypothetical protein